MDRRGFLTSAVTASATAVAALPQVARSQDEKSGGREYYLLRHYHLTSGAQKKLTDDYFRDALLPALNRLGISPVGVFNVDIGPTSPSMYVLMPCASLETLALLDFKLAKDSEYMKAGAAFVNAPAKEPAYVRIESSLMQAFEGMPKLTVPAVTAKHGARVFELRTYESPTDQDHQRKVEMFNSGEFHVFHRAGFWQVFYGDTLVGPNQPNLIYMVGFPDISERNRMWKSFFGDDEWKQLTHNERFSFESIVSNVTNAILSPTAYSQI